MFVKALLKFIRFGVRYWSVYILRLLNLLKKFPFLLTTEYVQEAFEDVFIVASSLIK